MARLARNDNRGDRSRNRGQRGRRFRSRGGRDHNCQGCAHTLDGVRTGEAFRIDRIDDEDARMHALRFGMGEGCQASCVTRIPAGPVIVKKGRQEIAIGNGLARKISVSYEDVCEVAS